MRYDLLVTLKSDAGESLAVSDYEIDGHIQCADEPLALGVVPVDFDRVRVSFGPVAPGYYRYDLFIRYRGCHVESRLLYGRLTVDERFGDHGGSARNGGEELEVVVQRNGQVIECRMTQVTIVSAADWAAIQVCADRAEVAAEESERLLAQVGTETSEAVRTVQETARQAGACATEEAKAAVAAVTEESGDALRQVVAEESASVRQSLESTATSLTGELHRVEQASVQRISDHTAVQVEQAEDMLATACRQGEAALAAAVTSGTGTIRAAADAGKVVIDDYVASVQSDLSRKSQPNIWSGVNTFNAPVVFNAGASMASMNVFAADAFADKQNVVGMLDAWSMQSAYGAQNIPMPTWWCHSSDTIAVNGLARRAPVGVVGKPSKLGAWNTAYVVSENSLNGHIRVAASNTMQGNVKSGVYAIYPRINAVSADTTSEGRRAIHAGLCTFFAWYDINYSYPVVRRPWDIPHYQDPHHQNWSQPGGVDICEAYGHRIATLAVYVGYGGVAKRSDGTNYYAMPAIRYKSPISDVSTITAYYAAADHNSQNWQNTSVRTYIQTGDGQLVSVLGTVVNGRQNPLGVSSRGRIGESSMAAVRNISLYPNIRPTSYYNNRINYGDTVHPIETYLEANTTYRIVRPTKPLSERISITYIATKPAEYPFDFWTEARYGYYGESLFIGSQAQDMTISCPDGWVIDVDIWSEDWCVAEGNVLHILSYDTGAERFVSVWVYAAHNTNTTDGTNVVWEYGIHQMPG